jgi:diguanylate cyclase (GGDEF)-like protein
MPLVVLLGAGLGGWWGLQVARDQAAAAAAEQLSLVMVQVRELLDRYELFPEIVAFCPCVKEALLDPTDPVKVDLANRRLQDITLRIRANSAFVMDTDGTVVAASNWDETRGFVGENYAVRPYFQTALDGATGRFVGIGLTSGKLGYYLARPVRDDERLVGVIAVKLDFSELQGWLDETLRSRRMVRRGRVTGPDGSAVLLADGAGVVFVSTNPAWLYRTLTPLSTDARARIQATRAYADEPLPALSLRDVSRLREHVRLLSVPTQGRFVSVADRLPEVGWELRAMTPVGTYIGAVWLYPLLGLLIALLAVTAARLLALREVYQRKVMEAAIRDPLTGLYSRLYMNETLPRLIARHNRDEAAALGVTILDVDLFKQVNDRYGHFAGDRVLSELGALIRAHCDDADIAVRLGGEEFALFHPQRTPGETLRLAERLRLLVQQQAVTWEADEIPVTISGGVAEHRPGESLVQMLQRADRALYQAKATGRNRIIDADPPTNGGLPPGVSALIRQPD